MDKLEQQYERVARVLDGEAVELTDADKALLDEVRTDMQLMDRLETVHAPSESLARARRRVVASSARPRHVLRWLAGTAAAAAILIAGLLVWLRPDPAPTDGGLLALPQVSSDRIVLAMQTDPESQLLIEAVAEIETVQQQLRLDTADTVEVDSLDRSLEEVDSQIDSLLDEFDSLDI